MSRSYTRPAGLPKSAARANLESESNYRAPALLGCGVTVPEAPSLSFDASGLHPATLNPLEARRNA